MESKTESEMSINDESHSEVEKLLPNPTQTDVKRSNVVWFSYRLLQVVLISSVVILILSLIDVWYYFQTLPAVHLQRGNLYLDQTDSTIQFSITGKSNQLNVKNNKLTSYSYLNSYEIEDTHCIVSYNKNSSSTEWIDFGYVQLTIKDTSNSIDKKNHDNIYFNVGVNDIAFHYLRDVTYLTYWKEAHAVKMQCQSGSLNFVFHIINNI